MITNYMNLTSQWFSLRHYENNIRKHMTLIYSVVYYYNAAIDSWYCSDGVHIVFGMLV